MNLIQQLLPARMKRLAKTLSQHYPHDPQVAHKVTDMLTDLRHLCDQEALDFGKLDRLAYEHYLRERFDSNP